MKVGDYVIGIPYFATAVGEIKGKITNINMDNGDFVLYRVKGEVDTLWCAKVKPVKLETLRRYFK